MRFQSEPQSWLDRDGRLTRGKYAGEDVNDLASSDPGYLRWILDQDDTPDEDVLFIRTALKFAK
jgi:hypothetical protein